MEKFPVASLIKNYYFSQPLYLDERFILLAPETPITEQMIARLQRWNFQGVLSDGKMVEGLAADSNAVESSFGLEIDTKEQTEFTKAFAAFEKAVTETETVFTNFINKNILPLQPVTNIVKDLIEVVKAQKQYILRLAELKLEGQNYIVVHSVRTAIVALALGIHFKLPQHKLIELGMAAHLHEIGMIKLPPQLYLSNKILTPQEKQAITAHTVLGFKILKAANFPMTVCLAVLESHENVDGTGYPRALTDDKISPFAKIVSISSVYSALTSARPFRHALDGHQSLLELLKGMGKRYDEPTVRGLVTLLSLYPIGTFVVLANSAIGSVVQTNEESPKEPVVRIIIGPNKERLTDSLVVKTEVPEYRIMKALSSQQTTEIKKTFNLA